MMISCGYLKLNEDNVKSSEDVIYMGKLYKTGNRYHTLVELYTKDGFYLTVTMKDIVLVRDQKLIFPK